jgi:hypothetical protein
MAIDKLIFVYNANSGKINGYMDMAHKIVSPSTYQCRLCDLTYGVFKENVEWARFRESIKNLNTVRDLEFLHIDEFEKNYKSKWLPKYEYPVILEVTHNGLELFMSNTEMNQITTTADLIDRITTKLGSL